MLEGFPRNNLLAEPLHRVPSTHGHGRREHDQQLTPITFCKSPPEYTLITLMATSRSQCFPFHTSANSPLYNAFPVISKEIGIFKVAGRTA